MVDWKEVNRLWWEYLLESEPFKEACRKMQIREEEMGPKGDRKEWDPLSYEYGVRAFGNVLDFEFEEWWSFREQLYAGFPKLEGAINYAQVGKYILSEIREKFRKSVGRDPDFDELIHNYEAFLSDPFPFSLIVAIDTSWNRSVAQISRELRRLISLTVKSPSVQERALSQKRWVFPIGQCRVDELQRYLEVYRISGGRRPFDREKVAEEVSYYKGLKNKVPDTLRVEIYRDFQKAKKIISNAAKGIFPGRY